MKGADVWEANKYNRYAASIEAEEARIEEEEREAYLLPKPKTHRLTGKGYTVFRREVGKAYNETCQKCGRHAPLLDPEGVFDVFTCGHVKHIKSRGAGGEDTWSNIGWQCYRCHIEDEHIKGGKE